jgi:small subunit ribosomal protein S16
MGAKKRPSYRIVAADSRSPRDGRVIESLGYYDPLTEPATVKVNEDRVRHWLSVGAQPSETVRNLLRRQGLVPDDPSRAGGKATSA